MSLILKVGVKEIKSSPDIPRGPASESAAEISLAESEDCPGKRTKYNRFDKATGIYSKTTVKPSIGCYRPCGPCLQKCDLIHSLSILAGNILHWSYVKVDILS